MEVGSSGASAGSTGLGLEGTVWRRARRAAASLRIAAKRVIAASARGLAALNTAKCAGEGRDEGDVVDMPN